MTLLVLGFAGATLDEVRFDMSAWDVSYDSENVGIVDNVTKTYTVIVGDVFSLADSLSKNIQPLLNEGLTVDELFSFILHELSYPYSVKRVLSFDSCSFGALPYNGFKVVGGDQKILAEDLNVIDELLAFFISKVMDEDVEINDRLPYISYRIKEILRTYFGLEVEEETIREYFRMAMESAVDQRTYFGRGYDKKQ